MKLQLEKTAREVYLHDTSINTLWKLQRAFAGIAGKDLDRFLKGQLSFATQAWPPKPNESFHELYNRARMAERHEKQYDKSSKNRKDAQSGR